MFTKSLITAGITAGFAAGLVFCAQPAAAKAANQEMDTSQRLVRYGDLDLSTANGQARLEGRLRSAASAVCGASYGQHPLNEAMEAKRCYRSAIDAAHRDLASNGLVKMVSR
ncbi:MAG: UrcA family protein [Novosphingobium sp.]